MIKNSLPFKISRLAEAIALDFSDRITPLNEIVLLEDLEVHYDFYGKGEFDGMTIFSEGYFSIHINLDESNKANSGRGRFTLAHELGHYIIDTHRIGLQQGILKPHPSFANSDQYNAIEREADYFASCLLMPRPKYEKDILNKKFGADLIRTLAESYNVSITACALRFVEVGNHPIMVVYAENGYIKWMRCSENFPYYKILERPRIPTNSVMSEYFRNINLNATSGTEEVWAHDWFENVKEWHVTRKFFEYCIPYKNKALSIIWEK